MATRRRLIVFAALVLPVFACGKGAAPVSVPAEVPADAPRQRLTSVRRVAMRRPDRLVGDASGDALNRSFWYDGQTFSALDREVQKNSTTTNKWGQSATRERTVEGQGGYATIEGSAKTSTGREASTHGRPYYSYGGCYYRPYTYHGVHDYYPVPVPYYAYYSTPPVGAILVMVAGVSYMMAKDGTYSKQTTSSAGKVVDQSVPPQTGASIQTLPAERVLVTVSGTTYYLSANAFYRRVVSGGKGAAIGAAVGAGAGGVAAAAGDVKAAVIPAQTPQAFTLAAPLQVELMTNVAVR